jgi:hypothetical protein
MLWRATVNPDRYLLRRNGFWLLRRDLNLQSGLITKLAENPFKERGPAHEVDAPALLGDFLGRATGIEPVSKTLESSDVDRVE